MNSRQKFLLGVAAGAVGALVGRHLARGNRRINFTGRVVVITGGSRGLGLVLARQLASEGARLCLLARNADELERAAAQFPPDTDVMPLRCDVRRRADVRAAIDAILDRWGVVDVLINNAGVIQVGPLEHMTTGDFENAMATHFWGPLHLMFEIVPSMRRRGFGRIVNISSIGGRVAVPHLAPYCASKFALAGLSDAVRTELDQYGIRVTTVAPGLMRTGSPVNADVKGQHEAEYSMVRDLRFVAGNQRVSGNRSASNHRRVPVRRSRIDALAPGKSGDRGQLPGSWRGRARIDGRESITARAERCRRQSPQARRREHVEVGAVSRDGKSPTKRRW